MTLDSVEPGGTIIGARIQPYAPDIPSVRKPVTASAVPVFGPYTWERVLGRDAAFGRACRYAFTMHRSFHLIALLVLASAAAAERRAIQPEGYNRGLPFTPGILVGDTLYVAGFSGEDPQTGAVPRDFEKEAKQALEKIGVILKAADMQYSDVVSVQVYLTDMKLFDRMNAVYRSYFSEPRPTRTIVGIAKLIGRSRIEITVTARKSDSAPSFGATKLRTGPSR